MYNITLINTKHKECGVCTSNELYKILEFIRPEVIFEEIPPSYFDKYYITRTKENLESNTVLRYSQNYNIQQIPVDSDDVPSESFFNNDLKYLYERIEGLTNINGFNYRNFSDRDNLYIKMYGFLYANSNDAIIIRDEIQNSVEMGLQVINNEKLFQTYQDWLKINENRENTMLQNIYNYSKENQYNQAVFLLGYAHRKSIMQKIKEYETKENLKLNWSFYGDNK